MKILVAGILPVIFLVFSVFITSTTCLDVTYEDIENVNATCKGANSCYLPRAEEGLEEYNCNCGSFCTVLGTCCHDSPYRNHNRPQFSQNLKCEYYYNQFIRKYYLYLMISSCDPNLENDIDTVELCNNGTEESSDPFLQIPVTDPVTGISYKNYYCYACNVNYGEQKPMPWALGLKGYYNVNNATLQDLHYNKDIKSWMYKTDEVTLHKFIPDAVQKVAFHQDCGGPALISKCASNWTDADIEEKCKAYHALARFKGVNGTMLFYRNPHCAICNFKSIENIICHREKPYDYSAVAYGARAFFVDWFNLERDATDCGVDMVYDHFAKKCRRVLRLKRKKVTVK